MDKKDLLAVLQTIISHWDLSARAYADYMENGKKFRYAEILKLHNSAVKKLLIDHFAILPNDLKQDAKAIIEHYTIWTSKWEALKNQINPHPDDEFVFENDHRFPKASAQRLEQAYNQQA